MNHTDQFPPQLLKLLFAKAVAAAGGHYAAAEFLGISRQRVGQLCDHRDPDNNVPKWDQVWAIEQAAGFSTVFAGLAEAIAPRQHPLEGKMLEAVDRIEAIAREVRKAIEPDGPANVVSLRGESRQ